MWRDHGWELRRGGGRGEEGSLPARQPIARLGWMIVSRDTDRLLQVGKGGHAGLAVELRLLHRVGEGEPEGLDELLPVLVVPKCQLRLYKVNWDRHAVSKSGRKEENTGEVCVRSKWDSGIVSNELLCVSGFIPISHLKSDSKLKPFYP